MFQQNKKNGDVNPIKGRPADLMSVEAIAWQRSAAQSPSSRGLGGRKRHRRRGGSPEPVLSAPMAGRRNTGRFTPAALEGGFLCAH